MYSTMNMGLDCSKDKQGRRNLRHWSPCVSFIYIAIELRKKNDFKRFETLLKVPKLLVSGYGLLGMHWFQDVVTWFTKKTSPTSDK